MIVIIAGVYQFISNCLIPLDPWVLFCLISHLLILNSPELFSISVLEPSANFSPFVSESYILKVASFLSTKLQKKKSVLIFYKK